MQVIACMYLYELSVLYDDKQIIQQRTYRKKCKEDGSFVDVCLSDCRSIISLEEKRGREREKGRMRVVYELISLAPAN
jgi:hypothetical protein